MRNKTKRILGANERREAILQELSQTLEIIPAKVFAINYGVSRQVIVQDITVLRAIGHDIISTNKGYVLKNKNICKREFKVHHEEDRVQEELMLIVNLGGVVRNVSISHSVYGRITASLPIRCKKDVDEYIEKISKSLSHILGSTTSGYHYHLIEAETEETLNLIETELEKGGFLAQVFSWETLNTD